jgi:hypothetical protein
MMEDPMETTLTQTRSRGTRARFALVLAAALLLSACETVKISDITNDPSKYRDKTVRVAGVVTTSFGVLSFGGYEIQDDTGKIYVISSQGVPAKDSRVVVEGSIWNGAMLNGQALGVAIRESKHEVH